MIGTEISIHPRHKNARRKIEDLAVLPVFFKLQAQPVLLIGGSAAAAWKAELLAAAGAQIHVCAPSYSPEFLKVTSLKPASYQLNHRAWSVADLDDKKLVIADIDCETEAKHLKDSALRAGVPVNVIDNPAFCDFQFGSIVNRSPAIVSISTNGAAPILGQAIRRKIEVLLPRSVRSWAQLARLIRPSVNKKYAEGLERRAFWERFVDRVFSGESPRNFDLDDTVRSIPTDVSIKIRSQDPDDLTLKEMRALQAADIIYYEEKIPDTVLERARREADLKQMCEPQKHRGQLAKTVAIQKQNGKSVVFLYAAFTDQQKSSDLKAHNLQSVQKSRLVETATVE